MSYLRNSTNTFDKCQKILKMFSQIQPHSVTKNPPNRPSTSKNPPSYYISKSTNLKSNPNHNHTLTNHNHTLNASRSALKPNLNLTNQYQSATISKNTHQSTLFRQKSNSSFVSCYKKQSRLQQIMKLKVSKPKIHSMARFKNKKNNILLNTSFSSLNSSRSSLNKENINRNSNKESRLQKIMNIKIQKPKVNSTLIGYQPRKCQRSASKSLTKKNSFVMDSSSIMQLKQVKKRQRKSQQIEQKQQRLWKTFQRQRQLQLKQRKRLQEQKYKQQRRKQEKYEKQVQKQLKKIQNSREISLRKERTFSPYVYPSY